MKSDTVTLILKEFKNEHGLRLNRILQFFKHLNNDSFIVLLETIYNISSSELTDQLIYYLKLFSEHTHIKELLSCDKIPLNLIEYLVFTSYNRALFTHNNNKAINSLLLNFSQKSYLKLLLESELVREDIQLRYYIATKLDRYHIDLLFNQLNDLNDFLEGLSKLPDETRQNIFISNLDFYGYVFLFATTLPGFKTEPIFENLGEDLSTLRSTKSAVKKICDNYDLESEKQCTLSARNCMRFAQIIKELEHSSNSKHTMMVMEHEGAILDNEEKSLISEILYNPIFKNIRHKYSTMYSIEH